MMDHSGDLTTKSDPTMSSIRVLAVDPLWMYPFFVATLVVPMFALWKFHDSPSVFLRLVGTIAWFPMLPTYFFVGGVPWFHFERTGDRVVVRSSISRPHRWSDEPLTRELGVTEIEWVKREFGWDLEVDGEPLFKVLRRARVQRALRKLDIEPVSWRPALDRSA